MQSCNKISVLPGIMYLSHQLYSHHYLLRCPLQLYRYLLGFSLPSFICIGLWFCDYLYVSVHSKCDKYCGSCTERNSTSYQLNIKTNCFPSRTYNNTDTVLPTSSNRGWNQIRRKHYLQYISSRLQAGDKRIKTIPDNRRNKDRSRIVLCSFFLKTFFINTLLPT